MPKKMQQRNLKNRNDLSNSVQQIAVRTLQWTLVFIMMLQQIKTTAAAKYKGDNCMSKNKPGTCKEWSECPVIKTLIESGDYTNREVVSCGFGIREELICCPIVRTETKIETTTDDEKNRFAKPAVTQAPEKDFWLDLLQNTTTSTTATPDFWLDLLNPTTSTTTIKPLIVGEQRLNESSEYFDFNALLSGKQSDKSKQQQQQQQQTNSDIIGPSSNNNDNNPSNQDFVRANGNGRVNPNTGPVNINHWSPDQTGNNFNNVFHVKNFNNGWGNNGRNNLPRNMNGNLGWGQQNSNMGRRPFTNNGNGHMNGVSPSSNGRVPNNIGIGQQNQGFVFPHNTMQPNNFYEENANRNRRPGRPVNNMQEQNPNIPLKSHPDHNNANSGDKSIHDLIKNVFDSSDIPTTSTLPPTVINNQNEVKDMTIEDTIANIFNVKKPQTLSLSPGQQVNKAQPVLWIAPQENQNNHETQQYVDVNAQHQQMELTHTNAPRHFDIIAVVENQLNSNDFNQAPSTNFIQQPVVVETWSVNPVHESDVNPVHVVYQNLVNSGMDILKAQETQIENSFNQQQHLNDQHTQLVVIQPQQQTELLYQQPSVAQNFGPQVSQQFIQQPLQMESSGKEPRSASQLPTYFEHTNQQLQPPPNFGQHVSQQMVQQPVQTQPFNKDPRSAAPLQQFVQQTHAGLIPNIQSPPIQILDPFKPFEFRPPPADENTFFDDNNSLSTNPSPSTPTAKANDDRPAVRACRRIEKGLSATLTTHILGGTPAELGEFPHMAALGYSRIGGDDRPPYDIRCGGTLIDKRFVVTAAHCVSERENVPSIVRLGVVNFTDATQMNAAIELRIKETYIHDEYLTRYTYNDIAVLELERDVEFNEYVYPVCLYTNETDPDTNIRLWVTGWGTVNTTTRSFSDILLKAPLHTSPLINCNRSFTEYGLNRRIPEGVIRSQFCAEDKDQIKDACQGDSGGPLNMVVDESYKNYRLVGVVSSGFGCASSTPGLYTRVAAFLDFIEKIVWPNGGD